MVVSIFPSLGNAVDDDQDTKNQSHSERLTSTKNLTKKINQLVVFAWGIELIGV